jgi:hypothetical protein
MKSTYNDETKINTIVGDFKNNYRYQTNINKVI